LVEETKEIKKVLENARKDLISAVTINDLQVVKSFLESFLNNDNTKGELQEEANIILLAVNEVELALHLRDANLALEEKDFQKVEGLAQKMRENPALTSKVQEILDASNEIKQAIDWQKSINSLLEEAMLAFKRKDWTTSSKGKSAFQYAKEVLDIESENIVAKNIIKDIIDKYLSRVREALYIENIRLARINLEKAKSLNDYLSKEQKAEINRLENKVIKLQKNTEREKQLQLAKQHKKRKIKNLLKKARTAFANGNLQTPKNDNAIKWVKEVQRIEPNNGKCITIVMNVVDKYIGYIKSARAKNKKRHYYKKVQLLEDSFSSKQKLELEHLKNKWRL